MAKPAPGSPRRRSAPANRQARATSRARRGATLWFTGLSGSGKSTIAAAVEQALFQRGQLAYRLDGDALRTGLNRDLGFSAADRAENVRRVGEVARLFADAGLIVLASFISPYREGRRAARRAHGRDGLAFIEVFVDCPLAVAEARDPKGLYRRARAGEIAHFTGIDDPYETPLTPDLHLHSACMTVEQETRAVLAALETRGLIARVAADGAAAPE